MLRKLLENNKYKEAFINRFSLLLATYYSPTRVNQRINFLMNAIAKEISKDQLRWNLSSTSMNNQLTTIKNFANTRPAQMQSEIEEFFKLENPVDFTISAKGNGKILVHNLPVLNNSATFKAYSNVPIIIKAVPNNGAKFKSWSDGNTEIERVVEPKYTTTLSTEFN
jgi:hypothetical protein